MSISPLISICIPSYNRTTELERLLRSIDVDPSVVEIVISEDFSRNRNLIRSIVEKFKSSSKYVVHYYENESNLGFDANIRSLVDKSQGDFIIFMGDDDYFIPGALEKYCEFIRKNNHVGYILRSYRVIHRDDKLENFHYFSGDRSFEPGESSVALLFKRSVSLCGFTINRRACLEFLGNAFPGLLLYQVYLMAKVCLRYPSVYCCIPIAIATQSYRNDDQLFGSSSTERGLFSVGKITTQNSLNFIKNFIKLSQKIDFEENVNITNLIRRDLSRHAYPILSIQRKRGIIEFSIYALRLRHIVGGSLLFYLYFFALIFLGEGRCDSAIVAIKNYLGYTPNLSRFK